MPDVRRRPSRSGSPTSPSPVMMDDYKQDWDEVQAGSRHAPLDIRALWENVAGVGELQESIERTEFTSKVKL